MPETTVNSQVEFNSLQQLYQYLSDPANYKPISLKSYIVWCCMPPVGTKVHNFLTESDDTTTEDKRFVLSGICGEQKVIYNKHLMTGFVLADGSPITEDTLKSKTTKNGTISWFQIKPIVNQQKLLFATFIPAQYTFQRINEWGTPFVGNKPGIAHGKGDFVVCEARRNKPDPSKAWIVNGVEFANTVNNKGWTDCIDDTCKRNIAPKPSKKVGIVDTAVQEFICVFDLFLSNHNKTELLQLQFDPQAIAACTKLLNAMKEQHGCTKSQLIQGMKEFSIKRRAMYRHLYSTIQRLSWNKKVSPELAEALNQKLKPGVLFEVKWKFGKDNVSAIITTHLYDAPNKSQDEYTVAIEDEFSVKNGVYICRTVCYTPSKIESDKMQGKKLKQKIGIQVVTIQSILDFETVLNGRSESQRLDLEVAVERSAKFLTSLFFNNVKERGTVEHVKPTIRPTDRSRIRFLRSSDIPYLDEFFAIYGKDANPNTSIDRAEMEDILRDGADYYIGFIEGRKIVGVVSVGYADMIKGAKPSDALMSDLYVIPEKRNQGIAERMIKRVFSYVKSEYDPGCRIYCMILEDTFAEYYEQFGFKPIGDGYILVAEVK